MRIDEGIVTMPVGELLAFAKAVVNGGEAIDTRRPTDIETFKSDVRGPVLGPLLTQLDNDFLLPLRRDGAKPWAGKGPNP